MTAAGITPVDPETAALLRLAATAQEAERYADAERLYREALDRAPDHRAARFNHAVCCLRTVRDDGIDARSALDSLEHLLELLDDEGEDAHTEWAALRCAVIYNRALVTWCDASRGDPLERRTEWLRAIADAREVCTHARKHRSAARGGPSVPDSFWDRLDAASATLLAGLLIAVRQADLLPEGRPEEIEGALAAVERWDGTDDPRTAYNFALLHLADVPDEPTADHDPALDRAFAALEVAVQDHTLVVCAHQDPLLKSLRVARSKQVERLIRRRLKQSGRELPPTAQQPVPVRRPARQGDDFDAAIPE